MIDLLQSPVTSRDHVRGPTSARVTLVEYADFACPFCAAAFPVVEQLLAQHPAELRLVFRHNPRGEVHEGSLLAAKAAEAAAFQGQFWPMHDLLFERKQAITERSLLNEAALLGLDVELFRSDLQSRAVASRVREDELSGLRSGVVGTPTFFLNAVHFRDKPDLLTLSQAIAEALTPGTRAVNAQMEASKWISN